MEKSLDRKLANIHAHPTTAKDFILADAQDADMAFGLSAPGRRLEPSDGPGRFCSRAEYRDHMREMIHQGLVDILLMSTSSREVLSSEARLFDRSSVTPAARANAPT